MILLYCIEISYPGQFLLSLDKSLLSGKSLVLKRLFGAEENNCVSGTRLESLNSSLDPPLLPQIITLDNNTDPRLDTRNKMLWVDIFQVHLGVLTVHDGAIE
jgi:hypothetical protein